MVTVYFKNPIDESHEVEFPNADNAYISDDERFLILTSQEDDDDITPEICGRFFLENILGYYLPYI